jgi:hypothetical protein
VMRSVGCKGQLMKGRVIDPVFLIYKKAER